MNSNHQGTQHATEGAGGEEEDEGVQEEVAQIVLNSVCLFVFVQSTRKRHQLRAEGWPHKRIHSKSEDLDPNYPANFFYLSAN